MAHESYAKAVLDKALELAVQAGGEVDCNEVSSAMMAQTRVQHKRVLNILSEHAREGRIHRIRQGVYGPLKHGAKQPDKREVMWRLLRMRRRIKVGDLVEMAGVSEPYAKEWLQMLTRREVVRKVSGLREIGQWVLVCDNLEGPDNTEKAAKLKKLRRKKESVLDKLKIIDTALTDVRQILQTMGDEE